jgi:hypothetical protein
MSTKKAARSRREFLHCLADFRRAAAALDGAWGDCITLDSRAVESDGYPFNSSFDEVCMEICQWQEKHPEEAVPEEGADDTEGTKVTRRGYLCMRGGCVMYQQGTLPFCSKRCDDIFHKRRTD